MNLIKGVKFKINEISYLITAVWWNMGIVSNVEFIDLSTNKEYTMEGNMFSEKTGIRPIV